MLVYHRVSPPAFSFFFNIMMFLEGFLQSCYAVPFMHLGREVPIWREVSCPRKWHKSRRQSWQPVLNSQRYENLYFCRLIVIKDEESAFGWLHSIRQPSLPVTKLTPRRRKPLSPFLSLKLKHARVYILFWPRIAVKWFDLGEKIFCWRQMSLNMCKQCLSVRGTASAQPS